MQSILEPFKDHESFVKVKKWLDTKKAPVHMWGMSRTPRAALTMALGENLRYKLIVTYSESRAEKLYQDIRFYTPEVYLYPAKDVLFYNADIHGNATQKKRLEIIKRIVEGENAVVIMTIDGLMDKLPVISEISSGTVTIKVEEVLRIERLRESLAGLGYEAAEFVDGPGQYSVRGGIIDIFPLTEDRPYRIELWGDTVDTIRVFDVDTQRSVENVSEVSIYPAREIVLSESRRLSGMERIDEDHKKTAEAFKKNFKTEQYARLNRAVAEIKEEITDMDNIFSTDSLISYFYDDVCSIIDYFPEDLAVIVDEPDKTVTRANMFMKEVTISMQGRLEGGYILPGQADIIFSDEYIFGKIAKRRTVLLSSLYKRQDAFDEKNDAAFETQSIISYNNSFDALVKDIKSYQKNKSRVIIVCPSGTRAKRLVKNLGDNDIISFFSEDETRVLASREVMVTTGRLEEGFSLKDGSLVVINESEIFTDSNKTKKSKTAKYKGKEINDISEIHPGDYVVHERHGIGIYRGIEKVETDGKLQDYINIEYGDGGKLFVPVDQMKIVGKYADKESAPPKLNRLSGNGYNEWEKTRNRVRGHVDDLAKELISLYAARSSMKGFRYSPDTVWQAEFEELFPYDETPDQLRAIEETKADMESDKIMDRLICGDVGFGKTEIAIRAAFKAVQDSRQVAYLVPTTILAQQHFETFEERFKGYPVNVKMLSRFCTAKEIKETVKGIATGEVDIVIGTHRLLSKDITFKKLGLLIIDEEQRFGVKHKEKIKELKKNVDVLTLTATPIPRTLHMSLIGLRDMSLLTEAPARRRPVQTYVMEYDKEFVREAINRELVRDGQVYYVYNRVEDIEWIVSELRQLIPSATIEYAHGKMNERELEDIMHKFVKKEIDVLVSTTIIETGLDIPNVNTIIIHNADRFGLSQLYQLRGRVGRSSRSSYAFLMYKKDKIIKEVAEKRLSAIREFTELGSGYKISMKDLEIRGSGNILGKDQSGHMEAVGYSLYCRMLNDAIKDGLGEEKEEEFETAFEVPVDAYISDDYVNSEYIKLDLYKEIARIENEEDADEVIMEVKDRFGPVPKEFERLIRVALLKAKAHECYIEDIKPYGNDVQYIFEKNAPIGLDRLNEFMKKYKGRIKVLNGETSGFQIGNPHILQDEELDGIEKVLDDIKEMLIGGMR